MSRVGLNPSTNRVQLKGGTRVMAGCCCTDEPCVDDEFTYGVLWPCLGIVYNDCTGAVINPPCLTVRMDRLPSGITAGTVVKIYGLCYTVNAVDLTRCEAISGGCSSGGVATEVALDPLVVIVQAGGVTCLSETCQCDEVGQYPLRCDRTVDESVKYCPSAGCTIRGCLLFGPGPLVCIEPGQSGATIPSEDSSTCCDGCNTCSSFSFREDSRNPESLLTKCCCGQVCVEVGGVWQNPCTFTYSSSWEERVDFNPAVSIDPAGDVQITYRTVTWSGAGCPEDPGPCPTMTIREWRTYNGVTQYDITTTNPVCPPAGGCGPPDAGGAGGIGYHQDYLGETGDNQNRGYKGCGGFADSISFVNATNPESGIVTTTASVTSNWVCSPQTICKGTCNNGGRGAAALEFGEV